MNRYAISLAALLGLGVGTAGTLIAAGEPGAMFYRDDVKQSLDAKASTDLQACIHDAVPGVDIIEQLDCYFADGKPRCRVGGLIKRTEANLAKSQGKATYELPKSIDGQDLEAVKAEIGK